MPVEIDCPWPEQLLHSFCIALAFEYMFCDMHLTDGSQTREKPFKKLLY